MNMPGFTAEASLSGNNKHHRITTRASNNQRIIAQSKMTCAFKAGRFAGRCLAAGFDSGDCYYAAADFNSFCNEYGL
jgi:hypothetical protein